MQNLRRNVPTEINVTNFETLTTYSKIIFVHFVTQYFLFKKFKIKSFVVIIPSSLFKKLIRQIKGIDITNMTTLVLERRFTHSNCRGLYSRKSRYKLASYLRRYVDGIAWSIDWLSFSVTSHHTRQK